MKTINLLTTEDLAQFKDELISQLKGLQSEKQKSQWLRSKNVRNMLSISDSTLQTLRIKGIIPSYKLGNSYFYKYDEIVFILEANKTGREGGEL